MTTTTTIIAAQVPASEFAVGDLLAESKKGIESGNGSLVASITGEELGRVQLRGEDGKVLKSSLPETKLWRGREGAEETPETPAEIPADGVILSPDQDGELPPADETPAEAPKAKKSAASKRAASKPKPAAAPAEGPKVDAALLLRYLTANLSTEREAPNKMLPFIDPNGVLRVKGEHWREWLVAEGIGCTKMEGTAIFRELGFPMKPFALPGEGRSYGFYTGPASAVEGTKDLPVRTVERAARAPKNPLAALTDAQRVVIDNALADFKPKSDELKAAHAELLALLTA